MQYILDGFDALPTNPTEEEKSNVQLRTRVREMLEAKGYVQSQDRLTPSTFKSHVAYEDLYGTTAYSAFVICHPTVGITRIEPHQQQVSGSVDRKFPFFLLSAQKAPEPNVLLLIEGKGHKKAAFDWLCREARECQSKQIMCKDLAEFELWL
ncbi:PD-(D/E)XK nuclease superfamily protein [Aeromonas bivalvium]|uniref:PD-(D/E)XK nuclease superfamily protein n=1 Tax=Aeromonas bivalvium TaxID=440079 RepID=UPI0038D109D1